MVQAVVKWGGLNPAVRWELGALGAGEGCGMGGVAGKCIGMAQNPDCEGRVPCRN